MDGHQTQAWLSAARFQPFLDAADGDHLRALALYDWHGETAAACFGMVHHFEVLVRNAIDGVLGDGQPQKPIKDTWLMDFNVLQPEGVKQVIVAVERLEKGKTITRGRVIAGVSFGFWAGLFNNHYEELWRQQLRYAFPHASVVRKDLTQRMRLLQRFRNRILTMTARSSRTSAGAATTCCSSPAGSIRMQRTGSPNARASTRSWPRGPDLRRTGRALAMS